MFYFNIASFLETTFGVETDSSLSGKATVSRAPYVKMIFCSFMSNSLRSTTGWLLKLCLSHQWVQDFHIEYNVLAKTLGINTDKFREKNSGTNSLNVPVELIF